MADIESGPGSMCAAQALTDDGGRCRVRASSGRAELISPGELGRRAHARGRDGRKSCRTRRSQHCEGGKHDHFNEARTRSPSPRLRTNSNGGAGNRHRDDSAGSRSAAAPAASAPGWRLVQRISVRGHDVLMVGIAAVRADDAWALGEIRLRRQPRATHRALERCGLASRGIAEASDELFQRHRPVGRVRGLLGQKCLGVHHKRPLSAPAWDALDCRQGAPALA